MESLLLLLLLLPSVSVALSSVASSLVAETEKIVLLEAVNGVTGAVVTVRETATPTEETRCNCDSVDMAGCVAEKADARARPETARVAASVCVCVILIFCYFIYNMGSEVMVSGSLLVEIF